jgi:aminocarboxymuconate-semialdehyde decarboxylase
VSRRQRKVSALADRGFKIIDTHWHHVPASFVKAVVDGKCRISGEVTREDGELLMKLSNGFQQELPDELTEQSAIAEHLDRDGVDVAVASVAPPTTHYWAEPDIALEVSRAVNDGFAELAESSGGRFVPLANVPLQDPALAVEEVRRISSELGFPGVAIGSNANGTNLGDEALFPFWEAIREHDLYVFVHGLYPLGKERLSKWGLSNFVGLPIDTAVGVASMIFGGVFDRLPGLNVCFSHGGGAFPYLLGRWDHGYGARLRSRGGKLRDPSEYLDSIYCDSLTHDQAGLRFLVERVGQDRVALGSDCPFDMGQPNPVAWVTEAIEDQSTREAILGRNVAPLVGLGS